MHFSPQPGRSQLPVSQHAFGEIVRTSAVSSKRRPPEKAHFDDLHLPRLDLGQVIQRVIGREDLLGSLRCWIWNLTNLEVRPTLQRVYDQGKYQEAARVRI
jgi:hypothetical protein